jgi:hypothetical protein
MALDTVSNGTYFEFDPLCNAGSLVMFKVLEHEAPRDITPKGGGVTRTVNPVLVDLVVLDGPLAKTVVRGESVIGAGIAGPLRRKSPGTDVVVRMAWGDNRHGGKAYPQANGVERGSADWATAEQVMVKTGGDPYSHAERSANPTASLGSTSDAPDFIEVDAATGGQRQYGQPTVTAPVAAPAVGGSAGPQWGEAPAAASNGQPVSAAAW